MNEKVDSATPTEAPVVESLKKENKLTKNKFLLIFPILILAIVLGAFFYNSQTSKNALEENKTAITQQKTISKDVKQWVNCSDVRKVIEEGNTLYVACLGGVLMVDKNSGKVVDQVSVGDGLSNSTATSLIKDGDILYIGTQDGFTIFNLKDRSAKKVSVKEGLISGSNIVLALDGDILWVGSFEGASTYNLKTGEIKNFTKEILDNSTKYSGNNLLVTPNAVYVNAVANAYTGGGIARFDKKSQQWERFGPASFGESGQYARIDIFSLVNVGGKIYAADYRNVWEADDKPGLTWNKVYTKPQDEREGVGGLIGGNDLKVFFDDKLHLYNPTTHEMKVIYPTGSGENIFEDWSFTFLYQNDGKVWFPYNNPWLSWIDTNTLKTGSHKLSERPVSFNKVLGIIDDIPIISATDGLWKYENNRFIKYTSDMEFLNEFIPIPDTDLILLFEQTCGMGCPPPKTALLNYSSGQIEEIDFPKIESEGVAGDVPPVSFQGIDSATKQISFIASKNDQDVIVKYNYQTKSFSQELITAPKTTPPDNTTKNVKSYEFKTNNKLFSSAISEGLTSYQTLNTSNGLLSDEGISSIGEASNGLWVTSTWGGLSFIPK